MCFRQRFFLLYRHWCLGGGCFSYPFSSTSLETVHMLCFQLSSLTSNCFYSQYRLSKNPLFTSFVMYCLKLLIYGIFPGKIAKIVSQGLKIRMHFHEELVCLFKEHLDRMHGLSARTYMFWILNTFSQLSL